MRARKWIAVWVSSLGAGIGTKRSDFKGSVKSKRKPWTLRRSLRRYHILYKWSLPPLTHFYCPISSISKDPSRGKQAIRKARTDPQARASGFQAEKSPCLPKFHPTLRIQSSPRAPSPATSSNRKRKRPQVCFPRVPQTVSIFTRAVRVGCKWGARNAGPPTNIFKRKKENKKLDFYNPNGLLLSEFLYFLPSPKKRLK